MGSRDGTRRRAARCADGRDHQRRHHPGPRALPGLPGRRGRDAGPASRRAGRGDGLRDPRRRGNRARGHELAGGGDQVGSRGRLACAGRARQDPLLARRRARPADRAGTGAGRVRARARGRSWARRTGTRASATEAARAPRPGRPCGRERSGLPRRGAGDGRMASDRSAHRRGAVSRRVGRLAGRSADAIRRTSACALGIGDRVAAGGAAGAGSPDDLVRRWHRDPAARRRGRRRRGRARRGRA